MKQTVTINLAGVVYHIDNDAYETLNVYLKSIEGMLEESDSKQEIMQDIEARVAELFNEHMKYGHVEVVNLNMVNDIIAQLGSPEMITTGEEKEAEASSTAEETAHQEEMPHRKKRFYRDTDRQLLGGVCAGLAQLIGIDVVWVRLLMLLLMVCQGLGLLVYILLWIIVPAANTAARRLEMRGIEPSAENIMAEVERVRESVDENGNLKQQPNSNWGCLRTLFIIAATICCLPLIIALVAIMFGLMAALVGSTVGIAVGAIPFTAEVMGITNEALTSGMLLVVGGTCILLIPVIVLIVWAVKRNKSREPMKGGFWITMLVLWILALLLTLVSGVKLATHVHRLEGEDIEDKMEKLGERVAAELEQWASEGGTFIVNGDTVTYETARQLVEDSLLQNSIEMHQDEFGDRSSEGMLEVTEE